MRIRARFLAAFVALVAALSACQMSVGVTTAIATDGSGTFTLAFQFDKEFIDVVQTSPNGRSSLDSLRNAGAAFAGGGWNVQSSEPDGGLRIVIRRKFSSPQDLAGALGRANAASAATPLSFARVFRALSITHKRSLFSTATSVSGTIDLTPERLAPQVATNADVRKALQQAARSVFSFRVTLSMPGSVSRYGGDPQRIDGGTIEWAAPFGGVTKFDASAHGLRVISILIAALIAAITVALAAVTYGRRRRRRATPLEGWEITAGDGAAPSDAVVAPQTEPAVQEEGSIT